MRKQHNLRLKYMYTIVDIHDIHKLFTNSWCASFIVKLFSSRKNLLCKTHTCIKAANNSWSSDNFSAKIQVLTDKILAWSDTVTGHF